MSLSEERRLAHMQFRRDEYNGAKRSRQDRRDHIAVRDMFRENGGMYTHRKRPIEDMLAYVSADSQGAVGSCTAFGLTTCAEVELGIIHGRKIVLDPQAQWNAQALFPTEKTSTRGEDPKGGDSKRNALATAKKFHFKELRKDGMYVVKEYARLKRGIGELRFWLKQGKPVYVSCSSWKPGERGGWSTWTHARAEGVAKFGGEKTGAHAFAIIGYDSEAKHLICVNSYGTTWGHYGDGTFRIRYADYKYLASDKWILFF